MFFGFVYQGKIYGIKITLREAAEVHGGKKLYEVVTLEVGSLEDAREKKEGRG